MITNIILAILAAVIPILWVWLKTKLDILTKDNELTKAIYMVSTKNMESLYASMKEEIRLKMADGKLDESEIVYLTEKLKVEAKKSGIDIVQTLAPEAYGYMIKFMVANMSKK